MATKAYVLIETGVGKTKEVLESLRQMEGVKEADGVTGEYDIVVVLEGDSLADIGDLITGRIHMMNGIQRTTTYVSTTSS